MKSALFLLLFSVSVFSKFTIPIKRITKSGSMQHCYLLWSYFLDTVKPPTHLNLLATYEDASKNIIEDLINYSDVLFSNQIFYVSSTNIMGI